MTDLSENLPGINIIGFQREMMISTQGTGKPQYFASGAVGYKMPYGISEETQKIWRQEYDLCDCSTCYDSDCRCRQKHIRFPKDAGGGCQCLRLAKEKSRYAFRNENGIVIIIPDNIIELITLGFDRR